MSVKDLMKELIVAIVDDTDAVEISEIQGTRTTILELRVAKDDLGKVIGKKGRIAGSIRTILNATAAKQRKKFVLEIVEDET